MSKLDALLLQVKLEMAGSTTGKGRIEKGKGKVVVKRRTDIEQEDEEEEVRFDQQFADDAEFESLKLKPLPKLRTSLRRLLGPGFPSKAYTSASLDPIFFLDHLPPDAALASASAAMEDAAFSVHSKPGADAGLKPSAAQVKAEREKTAGKKWFDLPLARPEWHKEAQVLRLRNELDPKRFYRAGINKIQSKYFAIGHFIPEKSAEASLAYTSASNTRPAVGGRLEKAMTSELMADQKSKAYAKKKFAELQRGRGQAFGRKARSKTSKPNSVGRKLHGQRTRKPSKS